MAGVLLVLLRAKRKRERAWNRLIDAAERRTEASFGFPKEGAPDVLVAFFEAAARGEVALLDDALLFRVPVNIRDGVGQTALHIAAHGKSDAAAQWLVSHGAELEAADMLGETALLKAARLGAERVVALLLGRGASTECKHIEGWTPLIVAALHGHEEIVRMLLARGARRDVTVHGKTPLMMAQQQGHEGVAALLM